jgi:phenylacetate-CoA ligase
MRDEPSLQTEQNANAVVLSVIAPCLNEEGNIDLLAARTLAVFDKMNIRAELVLVDDGSTDQTWTRIQAQTGKDCRVRGVRHARNQGMECAWRTGLNAAKGERVCLIDADLQNRPEDIALLNNAFTLGHADAIQAVRHSVTAARHRCLFTRGLNFLLNRVFGMRSKDNKSGFILCGREVLADILRHRYRYRYYQCFIGPAAHLRGYVIQEIDTVFDSRHAGRSFMTQPVLISLKILWETLKFRFEIWTERRSARAHCPGQPVAPLFGKVIAGEPS